MIDPESLSTFIEFTHEVRENAGDTFENEETWINAQEAIELVGTHELGLTECQSRFIALLSAWHQELNLSVLDEKFWPDMLVLLTATEADSPFDSLSFLEVVQMIATYNHVCGLEKKIVTLN